jgi:hypothetical protein
MGRLAGRRPPHPHRVNFILHEGYDESPAFEPLDSAVRNPAVIYSCRLVAKALCTSIFRSISKRGFLRSRS